MFTKETLEVVSKYGFATVAAIALSWAFYQFNIVPANEERMDAREERKATAKALVEANKESNSTTRSLADSYQKMTTSVESQTEILRQIRDDQRRGVWRATEPPLPSEVSKPEQP
jgi:hypothetical protein